MSRFFPSKTLIAQFEASAPTASLFRRFSSVPDALETLRNASELESAVVERIEDAIHCIIVTKSKPDWLPFVPGASYWVPPRRESYGVAEMVHIAFSEPTHRDNLYPASMRGLPSSEFYLNSKDDEDGR